MIAKDASIVLLAAGKGTRMRSDLAKVLYRAGGRSLIEHVLRACQPLKPAQLLVVVGHQAAEVGAVVTAFGAQTVLQEPQRGTGHAMQGAGRGIRTRPQRVSTRTVAVKLLPRFSPRSWMTRPTMAAFCAIPKAACKPSLKKRALPRSNVPSAK